MKNLESKKELNEHRWLGYAACNFEMLECQTCKLIVKRRDALNGLYTSCPNPHPKGGNIYKFTDEIVYGKVKNTKCKFGKAEQNMNTCKYIYIHWPGYYPTKELYEHALKHLCPNYVNNKT